MGLCEDAIFAPRLCYPSDETNGSLVRGDARADQYLAYDFKRPNFFPLANVDPDFTIESEGILYGVMHKGVLARSKDDPSRFSLAKWLSADMLLSTKFVDIETLVSEEMVVRRTHEEAYEIAGATNYIDDLRSRGMATLPVHQVTPKGHSLVLLGD